LYGLWKSFFLQLSLLCITVFPAHQWGISLLPMTSFATGAWQIGWLPENNRVVERPAGKKFSEIIGSPRKWSQHG
jgi:hypothetical protein